jgi:hypothetical protein
MPVKHGGELLDAVYKMLLKTVVHKGSPALPALGVLATRIIITVTAT